METSHFDSNTQICIHQHESQLPVSLIDQKMYVNALDNCHKSKEQNRTVQMNRVRPNELPHDKTNKMICAPSEDSDQPGHLIRVFTVRMKKACVLSYPLSAQRRLWSDWVDAQADLSHQWMHRSFCWFCHEVARMSMWTDTCGMWNKHGKSS